MNCSELLGSLEFSCHHISDGIVFVSSPLTIPGDGETIGAYVRTRGDMAVVTDNCATLMNLSSRGLDVKASRIKAFHSLRVGVAEVTKSGEIHAVVCAQDAASAVTDVISTSLAVARRGLELLHPSRRSAFEEKVDEALTGAVGNDVQRRVKLVGASGRQIEIPFVVSRDRPLYVQPVAYGEDSVPTENVYRGLGKMTELGLLDIPIEQRIVVLEDVEDDETVGQAISLLSSCATVLPFSRRSSWIRQVITRAA